MGTGCFWSSVAYLYATIRVLCISRSPLDLRTWIYLPEINLSENYGYKLSVNGLCQKVATPCCGVEAAAEDLKCLSNPMEKKEKQKKRGSLISHALNGGSILVLSGSFQITILDSNFLEIRSMIWDPKMTIVRNYYYYCGNSKSYF